MKVEMIWVDFQVEGRGEREREEKKDKKEEEGEEDAKEEEAGRGKQACRQGSLKGDSLPVMFHQDF